MPMKFEKIDYYKLNARQKENYNFHKVASALADYGYDSMRLNNDWEGADFISDNTCELEVSNPLQNESSISNYCWLRFENTIYPIKPVLFIVLSNLHSPQFWYLFLKLR